MMIEYQSNEGELEKQRSHGMILLGIPWLNSLHLLLQLLAHPFSLSLFFLSLVKPSRLFLFGHFMLPEILSVVVTSWLLHAWDEMRWDEMGFLSGPAEKLVCWIGPTFGLFGDGCNIFQNNDAVNTHLHTYSYKHISIITCVHGYYVKKKFIRTR